MSSLGLRLHPDTLGYELDTLRAKKGIPILQIAKETGFSSCTITAAMRTSNTLLYDLLDYLAYLLGADADVLRAKYPPPQILVESHQRESTVERDEEELAAAGHRHYKILQAIRHGMNDQDILALWPELTYDVLLVYHKEVDGKLSRFAKNGGMYDKGDGMSTHRLLCEELIDSILKDDERWLEDNGDQDGGEEPS